LLKKKKLFYLYNYLIFICLFLSNFERISIEAFLKDYKQERIVLDHYEDHECYNSWRIKKNIPEGLQTIKFYHGLWRFEVYIVLEQLKFNSKEILYQNMV